ncbi:MAG: hypothetical protein AAGC60_24645 [Acidobacteriota bacterium]
MIALLDLRSSFTLASLVVTWLAIVGLTLIVINLHVRMRRLERQAPHADGVEAYGRLVGRSLRELLGGEAPRLLLVLSRACPSCERLLDELRTRADAVTAAVAWTDGPPEGVELPSSVVRRADGDRVAAALGVRVTPFAVVTDADGRIVRAAPVNQLPAIR